MSVAGSSQPFPEEEEFVTRYCRWRGIARDHFVETLLAETLYPHARLLRRWLPADCFRLDREFLQSVGRLRRRRDFNNIMLDFVEAYEGRQWSRTVLCLRLSVDRVQALVRQVLAPARQLQDSAPAEPRPAAANMSRHT